MSKLQLLLVQSTMNICCVFGPTFGCCALQCFDGGGGGVFLLVLYELYTNVIDIECMPQGNVKQGRLPWVCR